MVKGLSVFSGVGGLDLGARLAGIDVVLATDVDDTCLRFLSSNQGTRVVCMDLTKSLVKINELTDDVHIVFGGPPCTPFSHAGFWLEYKRNGEVGRGTLLDAFLDVLCVHEPDGFVMENVPGMAFRNHRAVLGNFVSRAKERGFCISTFAVNAAECGVPQSRRRFFVVGVRSRRAFEFRPVSGYRQRTSRWAFADLTDYNNPPEEEEAFTGKYRDLLAEIPPGDNYLYFTEKRGYPAPKFDWRSRYWSFLLKLDPDHPSNTVPAIRVTNNGPFHWDNRHLRLTELKRLQGLPCDYGVCEKRPVARRHIGNAVPPLLAAEVLWQVRAWLDPNLSMEAPPPGLAAARVATTALDLDQAIWSVCSPSTGRNFRMESLGQISALPVLKVGSPTVG